MVLSRGIAIVAIIIMAGFLGAAVSTALNKDERTWAHFQWNSVIGIGASFLIPVFLATVSSKVLEELTKSDTSPTLDKYLVFAGFCVLGAISARHLITTLSEKVLQVARDAEKAAEEAKNQVQATKGSVEETKKLVLATQDAIQYGIKEQPMTPATSPALRHLDDNAITEALKSDDPWKNKFAGKAEANGRKLQADVTRLRDRGDSAAISLRVISSDPKRPLTGTVSFFIHPSFENFNPVVPVAEGEAVLNIISWGAFTVGALCDDGATQLELDLAELPGAWEPWKSR